MTGVQTCALPIYTGGDDVFEWLIDQGLVLSKPNPEGWAGIICPNGKEHTDGNPEGRYMPSTRSFCCLHSHCIDFDTKIFLQWVADNGGPKHDPGIRDDLMAATMQATLEKLQPSDFFTDDAAKVIEEVEKKEVGRLEKQQWYQRFAYVQTDDSYFDMADRREIGRGTFNAIYRHVSCRSIHNQRKVEASVCFEDRKSTRLNSSHMSESRMPSSA